MLRASLADFLLSSTSRLCTTYLRHMLHTQKLVFDPSCHRSLAMTTVRQCAEDSDFPPPSKECFGSPTQFPRGGYFMPPVPGDTAGPVCRFDFSAFYPSILQAHNVDYDRICCSGIEAGEKTPTAPAPSFVAVPIDDGISLCLVRTAQDTTTPKSRGFLSSTMHLLGMIRARYRQLESDANSRGDSLAAYIFKIRETAVKLSMNSVYGLLAMRPGGVFSEPRLASAITSIGRWTLQMAILYARSKAGVIVRAAATDSLDLEFVPNPQLSYADNMQRSRDLAKEICVHINSTVTPPIHLEQREWFHNMRYYETKNISIGLRMCDDPISVSVNHLPLPGLKHATGIPHVRRGVSQCVKTACEKIMTHVVTKTPWFTSRMAIIEFIQNVRAGRFPASDVVVSFEAKRKYMSTSQLRRVVDERNRLTGNKVIVGSRYLCYVDRTGVIEPYIHAAGKGQDTQKIAHDPDGTIRQFIACVSSFVSQEEAAEVPHIVAHASRLFQIPLRSSLSVSWKYYLLDTVASRGTPCDADTRSEAYDTHQADRAVSHKRGRICGPVV